MASRFDAEEFVFVWQTSANPEQAQQRMKSSVGREVSLRSVLAYASQLRRAGVPLKDRRTPGPANVVDSHLWQGVVGQSPEGFDVVVSCCKGDRPPCWHLECPPVRPDLPDRRWATAVVGVLDSLVSHELRVLVRCATGFLGKLVCAAYLVRVHEITLEEAIAWMARLGKLPPSFGRHLRGITPT